MRRPCRARGTRRPRGNDGSVLVLLLGLTAVLLLLLGVVVDVSAVVLAQRAVASAADGAAVSAVQGLDTAAFYVDGVSDGVPLGEQEVADRVAAYAAEAALAQPGLELNAAVEDGLTARVVATRPVALPFGGWLRRQGVSVTAVARARAPLAR